MTSASLRKEPSLDNFRIRRISDHSGHVSQAGLVLAKSLSLARPQNGNAPHLNGFNPPWNPVLDPIESVHCMDAILDITDPEHPCEPEWPEADFIIGNPPFLGGKLLRTNLGDGYVDAIFKVWDGRVPREADLCCYWFEKGRQLIEQKKAKRVGLLATQGIRGGANREVLKRIKETGDIFFAESDRDWILDGANVHVSMVGFDDGSTKVRTLNRTPVEKINPNLTAESDITQAAELFCNLSVAFMGDTKGGPFDISERESLQLLELPNPNGRPNSDVLVPWANGLDLLRRPRGMWIIDFGMSTSMEAACQYEAPFAYADKNVRPVRASSRTTISAWWLHERPRVEMRDALSKLPRFICTPRVSKYRMFLWQQSPTLPDSATFVFARSDDYCFGILHSRLHEVWARAQGTQVRERESGFRYTPRSCFETFAFPEPIDQQREAIAEAARELNALRCRSLNPPEWTREETLEFPGSVNGPWQNYVTNPDACGIGTVRYPRLVAKDAECAKRLEKCTLTEMYNKRETWLDLAHHKLDESVFAAYGWKPDLTDDQILEKLLALNLERAKL